MVYHSTTVMCYDTVIPWFYIMVWQCHNTYSRTVVYQSKLVKHGIPWCPMVYHVPWYTMVHDILWYTMVYMVYHGVPWYTMVYHGIWYIIVYHGVHGAPWCTVVHHGIPWYMVYYFIPWCTWCTTVRLCRNTLQSNNGTGMQRFTTVYHRVTV